MIRVSYTPTGKREYWLSNLGEIFCAIIVNGREIAWIMVARGIGTRSPSVVDRSDKQAASLIRARPEGLAFIALHGLAPLTLADRFALTRKGLIPSLSIGGY